MDPIAIFHNEKSTLGFADGHAERYNCSNKDTINFSKQILDGTWPNNDYGYTDPSGPPNVDIQYLKRNYAHR